MRRVCAKTCGFDSCAGLSKCKGVNCGKHGKCKESNGKCDCDTGYSGQNCEIVSKCLGVYCGTHG